MKTIRLALGPFLAFISTFPILSSAQPGLLDITFNPGTGADAEIWAVADAPDGKLVVAGGFTVFNGVQMKYVARLFADGQRDDTFYIGAGPNLPVRAVLVESSGKIIIAGDFTMFNSISRPYFARLRTDGSLDLDFRIVDFNNSVRKLERQTDGTIIALGTFTAVDGISQNCIVRLDSNYQIDLSFNPAAVLTNAQIADFVKQPDGKFILAGNASSRPYLSRVSLDGLPDPTFSPGFINGSRITAVALQPDGKIIVAGIFDSINGYSRINIARLHNDGSVDTTFVIPGGIVPNYDGVKAIKILSNNAILVTGDFVSIGGQYLPGIARLHFDASLDMTFVPRVYSWNGVRINVCNVQADGQYIIAGEFTRVGDTNINRIARLSGDGPPSTDVQLIDAQLYFGTHLNGTVSNTYRIEWTTNLNTLSLWTPLFNVMLETNMQFICDPQLPIDQRFYRAVQLPP
ncbi:MAG: delta-60 repeat domain-containing protein [Verrucomicrobia bacterium]|nr:delta-60 repeat domain-containing protein [Verrucomicrobiota bacterium]